MRLSDILNLRLYLFKKYANFCGIMQGFKLSERLVVGLADFDRLKKLFSLTFYNFTFERTLS